MTGIYKIASPSGRIYVGQSVNIRKRFAKYKALDSKNQIKLHRSFLKHGIDSHTFEIIEECSIENLNERERFWQDHFDVLNGGLNCQLQKTDDKSGYVSEETKEKIRKYRLGKKLSDSTKSDLSILNSGKNNPMYGKTGKNHPAFGYKFSKKDREERSKRQLGNRNHSAKLLINTDNGIFHYTIKEASEIYSIPQTTLRAYLSGKLKNKTSLRYA